MKLCYIAVTDNDVRHRTFGEPVFRLDCDNNIQCIQFLIALFDG